MTDRERALSECVALILIAFLVILVALFIIAALTGVLTGFLQKTALVAVTASAYPTGPGTQVIQVYHKQGDAVNLNNTAHTGGNSIVAISLVPPGGSPVLLPFTGIPARDAWRPGESLYIFQDGGGRYWYTDSPPAGETLSPLGEYTVIIIDSKAQVLLHTLKVTIP
jgi:hypothetical protein